MPDVPRRRESGRRLDGLLLGAAVALVACAERIGPVPAHASVPSPSSAKPAHAEAGEPSPVASDSSVSGRRPDQDLDAEHLHERVDGAAPALVSLGCRRLLYYRLEAPPADLEILVFATPEGAHEALVRDAGDARGSGLPGDEAWANEQCIFFRRGDVYVRLIADDATHAASVREEAERVAAAMARREIPPW